MIRGNLVAEFEEAWAAGPTEVIGYPENNRLFIGY
jgi:hypothetical protein